MLLHDPSRGTCCRNRCSGCAYLDPKSGDFACDEYTAAGGGADDPCPGGWLAPYVVADFGDRVHASSWGRILFPGTTDAADEDGDPEVAPPPPTPRGGGGERSIRFADTGSGIKGGTRRGLASCIAFALGRPEFRSGISAVVIE